MPAAQLARQLGMSSAAAIQVAKQCISPPTSSSSSSSSSESKSSVDGGAVAQLRATIASIDAQLETQGDLAETSLFTAKVNALAKLAKLTGEDEVTMQQIVRSSAWRIYRNALEDILSRHPAAAADVAALIASYETN